MKVLIVGSWRKEECAGYEKEAEELGKILAKRGHILVSGGGTGISELVVNSYRHYKGKRYICYIPNKEDMERVGEKLGTTPDELIETNASYPERNIRLVRNCDSVIAIYGGLGTLTEIIHAVKDYDKKVSVLDKGKLASWIRAIPELSDKVFLTCDIAKAVENIEGEKNCMEYETAECLEADIPQMLRDPNLTNDKKLEYLKKSKRLAENFENSNARNILNRSIENALREYPEFKKSLYA